VISIAKEQTRILRHKLTSVDNVYLYQLVHDICQEVEAEI